MSLHDELDQSFDSETTLTAGDMDGQVLGSLAMELESTMDETYESDSPVRRRHTRQTRRSKRRSSITRENQHLRPGSALKGGFPSNCSDYSGDEWGDPADDSDPDGRFTSLDQAIEEFVECLSQDLDSAYESQDDSKEVSVGRKSELDKIEPIERLINGLQSTSPQDMVESKASNFINAHNSTIWNIYARLNDLREIVQSLSPKQLHDLELPDPECAEILSVSLDKLLQSLPTIDFGALHELTLLEAETNALIADLSLLSDSLQETKQMANIAQRSLRSTRDNVDQWKSEIAGVERARQWLETRGWEDKLSNRTTSKELLSIRRGFEEVCDDIRKQIEVT